jgi:hypothetical protein
MKAVYDFVITPKKSRYENTKKVGDTELILNTEIYNHQFVSREAIVTSVPLALPTNISVGDTVITHHNVFRRWLDVRGVERNSRSYFDENTYFIKLDQIFLYKTGESEWKAADGFCFVKPIIDEDNFAVKTEKPLTGVVKYLDEGLLKQGIKPGDVIGFTPHSEYEFKINGERLYRVMTDEVPLVYPTDTAVTEFVPNWTNK